MVGLESSFYRPAGSRLAILSRWGTTQKGERARLVVDSWYVIQLHSQSGIDPQATKRSTLRRPCFYPLIFSLENKDVLCVMCYYEHTLSIIISSSMDNSFSQCTILLYEKSKDLSQQQENVCFLTIRCKCNMQCSLHAVLTTMEVQCFSIGELNTYNQMDWAFALVLFQREWTIATKGTMVKKKNIKVMFTKRREFLVSRFVVFSSDFSVDFLPGKEQVGTAEARMLCKPGPFSQYIWHLLHIRSDSWPQE